MFSKASKTSLILSTSGSPPCVLMFYGYYSNVCRGQRKKANEEGLVPSILQLDESSKGYRKNRARLMQKIYEIDPLTCPKCHGPTAVIAFIEAEDVIEKILKHLGLWELTPRPPSTAILRPST
jgi:hypothetical protein